MYIGKNTVEEEKIGEKKWQPKIDLTIKILRLIASCFVNNKLKC